MKKMVCLLAALVLMALMLVACVGGPQAPSAPATPAPTATAASTTTPASVAPQKGETLLTGHSYKLDWDGEYALPIGCASGGSETRFIALDALDKDQAKISLRGFGWLADGNNLVAEICGKRQILGTIEVYEDNASPNGWGVTIHILDAPIPTDRG